MTLPTHTVDLILQTFGAEPDGPAWRCLAALRDAATGNVDAARDAARIFTEDVTVKQACLLQPAVILLAEAADARTQEDAERLAGIVITFCNLGLAHRPTRTLHS